MCVCVGKMPGGDLGAVSGVEKNCSHMCDSFRRGEGKIELADVC